MLCHGWDTESPHPSRTCGSMVEEQGMSVHTNPRQCLANLTQQQTDGGRAEFLEQEWRSTGTEPEAPTGDCAVVALYTPPSGPHRDKRTERQCSTFHRQHGHGCIRCERRERNNLISYTGDSSNGCEYQSAIRFTVHHHMPQVSGSLHSCVTSPSTPMKRTVGIASVT